jgi:hypothetical protein
MTTITVDQVEVSDTETEIIEPYDTPRDINRTFDVSNGEEAIIATAWGSNDGDNWIEKDSKPIRPNSSDSLVVGPTVCWVKLTGKTMSGGTTSIVDATLSY